MRPRALLPFLALAAALPAAAQTPDTVHYTFVAGGRVTGSAWEWQAPDGTIHAFFEYNDRGRGPRMHTRLRVDSLDLPVWIEAEGVNYYKVPVRERFELRQGRAAWENSAERGERAVDEPAYYLPMDAPLPQGGLTRALLALPGHSLPLLPEGRIRLEPGEELEVSANGQTKRLRQYLLTGFGFAPDRVWHDETGAFFAGGSDWGAVVQVGWESVLPQLFRAQEAGQAAWAAGLARSLAHPPAGPVVIRNANLFDAETGASRPGTSVVIAGNRIQAVGPDGSLAAPAGATVIDAGGKALLPGLWDMHVHIGITDGPMHLGSGITSVRDLANDSVNTPRLARAWSSGEMVGPRVILSGFIDGAGPYAAPIGVIADSLREAMDAVGWYASHGYEQIKLYSSLPIDWVPPLVAEAHRLGMRVSGHIPEGMRAEDAVRAGFDEIQHLNFVVLNFLSDTLDTRTPHRFHGPAREAALLDLEGPAMRGFISLLRERGTVVDPTINIFERQFTARAGTLSPAWTGVAHRLPATVRRGLLVGGLPVPEGMNQRYLDSYQAMLRMVAMLYREGITIVPGTDALPGFALHRELELYAQAGIPAPEVLRIATLGAARVARRDRELGSIVPGKLADLILVDGDPASRISDIRNVSLVIKDGVIYDPAELWTAVGVLPRE